MAPSNDENRCCRISVDLEKQILAALSTPGRTEGVCEGVDPGTVHRTALTFRQGIQD